MTKPVSVKGGMDFDAGAFFVLFVLLPLVLIVAGIVTIAWELAT